MNEYGDIHFNEIINIIQKDIDKQELIDSDESEDNDDDMGSIE